MKAYTKGITKEDLVREMKAHQVADRSVNLVRNYFKKLGYKTTSKSKTSSNGFDLVLLKGSKSYTIEIKTAFLSSRAWKVGKTFERENDFIAIVLPNKKIHIEEWKSHKSKCQRNGTRCITKIANLYA